MTKLVSLTLDALRGATQTFELKFERKKPICIIYGENASGKSTICDALDILGSGTLSSLSDKGLSAATTKYWHSTNRGPGDIKVQLVSSETTWSAQVVKGKVVLFPTDPRPKTAILRRHKILSLLAKPPGQRYEALRPFIALEAIDQSETTLRRVLNTIKDDLRETTARVGENLIALEDLWGQAGSKAPVLDWAEKEATRDEGDLNRSISRIQSVVKMKQDLDSRLKDLEAITTRFSAAQTSLTKAEQELTNAVGAISDSSEELTQLLQAASRFFQVNTEPEECPLCESKEYADTLAQAVEAKLIALSQIRKALNSKTEATREFDLAKSQLQNATRQAVAAASAFSEIFAKGWPTDLPTSKALADVRESMTPPAEWTDADLHAISAIASTFTDKLEPELAIRIQRRTQLQTVKNSLKQYHHNTQQKGELDSLLPRLERTHEILVQERRAFVDDILGRIAKRVGELYEVVHPGEGLNKVSLELDPDKRASLDVLSQFPGASDSPPGAYLSESHLDTLGICIFLALAELESPEETILVLDDVIASVDEPHVDRIIEMLYDVSQKFAHCILTTHYTPWKEKYKWGQLAKGECQFLELGKWTWNEGIISFGTRLRIDRLRELLSDALPEISEAVGSAGIILEALLDFITLQYNCAVPRRRIKPTLADLLPSINKKLRGGLRVEMYDKSALLRTVHLGPILDELGKLLPMRNIVGAHYNELAFQLPGKDGKKFAQLVLELADALVDPEHGWPASDRSGEYWTNSGKTRRLYPLQQPS